MEDWQWQPWAIFALTLFAGIAGWFLREMWAAVKELRGDLQALKDSMPATYSRRDEVRDMFQQLLNRLDLMHGDLRHKADK